MASSLLDIPVIFGLSIEVYFILILLGIPTYFFWRWLFKKFIPANKTRQIAVWISTLIVTPALYIGLIGLFLFSITYTSGKDFDKQQWMTNTEVRFEMAEDIIQSQLLIDKDTNQIKQILGKPTWNNNLSRQGNNATIWTYDMGMGGGGLGFLLHNLVIKFDNNKVVSVEHAKIRD